MQPTLNWLCDPEVFNINRLNAHSDHKWYTSQGNYEQNIRELFQPLDGCWQFKWSDCPDNRPSQFFAEDYSLAQFDNIQVPSHIELCNYGQIQYINTMYPWDGVLHLRPPQVDMSCNPVGSYVRFFDLNEPLLNKRVCISFQGVEQAFYVWLNGTFVGYSEDSFTPSDFDLTPYLRDKNNRLCVEVYKHSSAAWLEDQDFFRFSGIFRSVYLYAKPQLHIEDMWLQAGLLTDNITGTLRVRLQLSGQGDYVVKCKIKGLLNDTILSLEQNGDYLYSQNIQLNNVHAWSNESPCLYKAELYLYDANMKLCEVVPYSIGFRRFELEQGIMMLNGQRIVFNGVNRHEWSATRGRCITADDQIADMHAIKRNNINAVRTSHYPNQSLWYELCDENGIYLIDEANLESHGSWQKMGAIEPSWNVPGSQKEWTACVVDRAKSMFERDKNHASILIWSCGNESYAGDCIAAMGQFFRDNDPSRLVHYEGVVYNRDYDYISHMESRMYATPQEIREYLLTKPSKPFILCEYMHNMGNSIGGMESYIDLIDEFPQYQGGFIWDFKDQALFYTDAFGRRVLGYGGDFGERPTDYAFSGNGILFADGSEKPSMQEVKYWYDTPINRKRFDNENNIAQQRATLTVQEQKQSKIAFAKSHALKIVEGDITLGVYGKDFSVLFSYTEGGPVSLICKNTQWLHRAPRPALWRASTENDKGNAFANNSAVWLGADALARCIRYEVLEKSDALVCIKYTFALPCVPQTTVDITYTVTPDCALKVHAIYHGQKGLPQLPCFGVRLESFEPIGNISWQGLSGETYPDRQKGGAFGMHSELPSSPRYLVPQEYGTHVNTIAAYLHKNSETISILAHNKAFAFSALPYTALTLEAACHKEELPNICRTALTIYGAMRGVGGINSWGADVEPAYQISAENDHEVAFCIYD